MPPRDAAAQPIVRVRPRKLRARERNKNAASSLGLKARFVIIAVGEAVSFPLSNGTLTASPTVRRPYGVGEGEAAGLAVAFFVVFSFAFTLGVAFGVAIVCF